MCGGTWYPQGRTAVGEGLSPRVRGNQFVIAAGVAAGGSIPACAGKPQAVEAGIEARQVYPRVCGGTVGDVVDDAVVAGLSPRVRGNPFSRSRTTASERSIPACAGEPSAEALATGNRKVYPRVCGGTQIGIREYHEGMGLSPRVRGNLARRMMLGTAPGSIPACAGEPTTVSGARSMSRVYPRVCGGTWMTCAPTTAAWGLSPRVRGNPLPPLPGPARLGSIPACAGEPTPAAAGPSAPRVYPRVCGRTSW